MPANEVGNLPAETTSFIGRRRELTAMRKALSEARLLTLAGPPGVGKTRLAHRLAHRSARAFTGGAWLAELADLTHHSLVAQRVAEVFGLRDDTVEPLDLVIDHLRDKDLLLVLDNCEHLADGCSMVAAKLLAAVPGLRVVTTSRQVLRCEGKQAIQVSALTLPTPSAKAGRRAAAPPDSVALFTARARAACPGFDVDEQNRDAVDAICRRLAGIPLAIELAAVRMRMLTAADLAARLEDSLSVLTTGSSTAPERQQTLEAALGWSYDLCSPDEQSLWRRLSVFADGFTLPAAEAIFTPGGDQAEPVLDLLSGLVDKSIVTRVDSNRGGTARYRLLEVIRQFGAARLAADPAREQVRAAHAQYFRALAARGGIEYCAAQDVAWFTDCHREHANLRAALDFSLACPSDSASGLIAATQLRPFWQHNGSLLEGKRWLARALSAHTDQDAARARGLAAAAFIAVMLGDANQAASWLAEGQALVSEINECPDASALVSFNVALVDFIEGRHQDALAQAERALEQSRSAGDDGLIAECLAGSSLFAFVLAAPQAATLAAEFHDFTTRCGSHLLRAIALWVTGLHHWRSDDQRAASATMAEAVAIFERFSQPAFVATCIYGLAWSAAASSEPTRAATLMGTADAIWRSGTLALPRAITDSIGADVERTTRHQLGPARFAKAFRDGAGMTARESTDYALGRSRHEQRSEAVDWPHDCPLTTREREVSRLVAQGASNKQLADQLVISVRTAETHVEHILAKLGYHSRAQIAEWVQQSPRWP